MKRRSFLQWLFGCVSALWVLGFAFITVKFLKPPESVTGGESNLIRVGPLESLQAGEARFFPHARQPVWVMRLPSDEVIAVSAICTHFHCIVKWENSSKIF